MAVSRCRQQIVDLAYKLNDINPHQRLCFVCGGHKGGYNGTPHVWSAFEAFTDGHGVHLHISCKCAYSQHKGDAVINTFDITESDMPFKQKFMAVYERICMVRAVSMFAGRYIPFEQLIKGAVTAIPDDQIRRKIRR